jgi:hypothetical protein
MVIRAVVAAAVASFTRRFVYLATTTFVLAGLFRGFLAYWRAGSEELIRGAAIIRDGKKAIEGIYVAEGSGRAPLRVPAQAPSAQDRSHREPQRGSPRRGAALMVSYRLGSLGGTGSVTGWAAVTVT